MRAVAFVALALCVAAAVCASGVAAHDKPKRVVNPKVAPRIVAHGIKPKTHVHYDVPRGYHKANPQVLQPATAPAEATATVATATVPAAVASAPIVLKATPNTPGCAAKGGACGDRAACMGTIASGLCPGASYCCVKGAAPAPSTANTAACAAKSGVCGDRAACRGAVVSGLCGAGAAVCCTPTAPAPAPGVVTVNKAYLLGKFSPASHPDFRSISTPSGTKYIRKDVYAAYQLMNTAARNELGFELTVLSATRTFDDQKAIWERKWSTDPLYKNIAGASNRALAIMSYSSMPSTSQHHWGTSFDLWSLEPKDFKTTDKGKRLDAWFKANAARFGFCRPFSPKPPRATGYNEEQWHVSYKPVLKQLIAQYKAQVSYADITGFSGSETAQAIGAIDNFVYGIDPECLA